MRAIDTNTLNALPGSRTGDALTVWAWYNGALASPDPLPVSSWALDWDTTRTAQTLTLTVSDPTGALAPWLLSDPLGVGGARLQCIYRVGGAGSVNMGWYAVTASDPDETWSAYTITEAGTVTPDSPVAPGSRLAMVPRGATIQVQAADLGAIVGTDRLLAPDSPHGTTPTIVGEITRLLQDICPVVTVAGVTDRNVNKTLIYKDDRMAAVQDLAQRIGCDIRWNGDGQCEVYPITSSPVATLRGGPEGLKVAVNRSQKRDGLYNVFVADGTATVTAPDGTKNSVPIRGVAQITAGPLRVGGPHGRYPLFYSSTMLTTQAECDAYAATMRDTQIKGMTTDLKVTALPMPHLQAGDWVTVYAPLVDGRVAPLNGRVKTMRLAGAAAVGPMELTVACAYADVAAAFNAPSSLTEAGPVTINAPVPVNTTTTLYPSGTLYPSSTLYPRS